MDETDEEIRKLRNMFAAMLERYFHRNYQKFSKMNQMQTVHSILAQLPYLSDLVK